MAEVSEIESEVRKLESKIYLSLLLQSLLLRDYCNRTCEKNTAAVTHWGDVV